MTVRRATVLRECTHQCLSTLWNSDSKREKEGAEIPLRIPVKTTTNETKDNLLALFPQVFSRSLVRGPTLAQQLCSGSRRHLAEFHYLCLPRTKGQGLKNDNVNLNMKRHLNSFNLKSSSLLFSTFTDLNHNHTWHLPLKLIYWNWVQKALVHTAAFVGMIHCTWGKQMGAQNNPP